MPETPQRLFATALGNTGWVSAYNVPAGSSVIWSVILASNWNTGEIALAIGLGVSAALPPASAEVPYPGLGVPSKETLRYAEGTILTATQVVYLSAASASGFVVHGYGSLVSTGVI